MPEAAAALRSDPAMPGADPRGGGRSARGSGRAAPPAGESCRLSRDIAGAVLDVPAEAIARPNRAKAEICHARHVAMYLAHVVFQVPLGAIAREFGRDRTSVAHAIRRVEDRRDDRAFDALLARQERLGAAVRTALVGLAAATEAN